MSILIWPFGCWDAVAEGCHDELDVNLLRWTGTTVVSDGDVALGPAELGLAEGAVEFGGVVVEPATPGPVVRPT